MEQPENERALRLIVSRKLDEGPPVKVGLIIETMGRHSNMVLVDEDDVIMDALKRLPPDERRERVMLPHHRYQPSRPQLKLDGADPALEVKLRGRAGDYQPGTPLWRLLLNHVAGIGPEAAREMAARGTGDPRGPSRR